MKATLSENALGTTADDTGFHPRRAIFIGIGLVFIVLVLSAVTLSWILSQKEDEFLEGLEKRLALMADGRAEVVSTWLSGLEDQGGRVVQADLFRLFAAEVDLRRNDPDLLLAGRLATADISADVSAEVAADGDVDPLVAQLPMMQTLLEEFSRYSGFLDARIIDRGSRTVLATNAATQPLTGEHRRRIQAVLGGHGVQFTPVRPTASGLVMGIYLPILPPQEGPPVAVLMLTRAVSDKINALLSNSPLMGSGELTRLIQARNDGFEEIVPWMPGELAPLVHGGSMGAGTAGFSVGRTRTDQRKAYHFSRKVEELDWWVVQEADYQIARQPLLRLKRFSLSIVVLVILTCSVALGALWWRLVGIENRRSAQRFKTQAKQIDEQRQLLDSINNTITEYMALKDLRGFYQYVNPAFAAALGRDAEAIVGLDDTALFGYDTARRLETTDRWVLTHKRSKSFHFDLYLQSRHHHLHISKVPFLDPEGKIRGIVSLIRDITEMVEVRQRSEKAVRQTIEILVKAIERSDPYLSGHTRLLRHVSQAVATELNLDERETATLEIAANLSQVGKLFVEPELLNKPGRLTTEERVAVERHVVHAEELLRDVSFDLPIAESVIQMNELLDGSGYPKGLKGEEIILPAQVLAVANTFCAMVKPRAYRPPIPAAEALDYLMTAEEKYAADIVAALVKVARSSQGERLLQ
jgi:PAS domain S-box-containing protein